MLAGNSLAVSLTRLCNTPNIITWLRNKSNLHNCQDDMVRLLQYFIIYFAVIADKDVYKMLKYRYQDD